jgi:ribosomal-protein-alanine N-acetyltransferase
MTEKSKVFIKEFGIENITDEYVEWINDIEVKKHIEYKKPATKETLIEYFKEMKKNPNILFFAIYESEHGKHIGNLKIEVNKMNNNAFMGILIGRKYWNKHYGTEAIKLGLDYCFNVLKLEEVKMGTSNPVMFKILERLGFKKKAVVFSYKKSNFIKEDYLTFRKRK